MPSVLVIEDNPDNLALAAFLLESVGHTVLLMDIQLPGMDGLEATALLKRDDATRHIPVIALTALAMRGDEARIRAAGCDGYIAKPWHYPDFLAAVAAQLARSAAVRRLSDAQPAPCPSE
jgi:two-component system cell cycle response regulator DivK